LLKSTTAWAAKKENRLYTAVFSANHQDSPYQKYHFSVMKIKISTGVWI
jgi:hypothetical protein